MTGARLADLILSLAEEAEDVEDTGEAVEAAEVGDAVEASAANIDFDLAWETLDFGFFGDFIGDRSGGGAEKRGSFSSTFFFSSNLGTEERAAWMDCLG